MIHPLQGTAACKAYCVKESSLADGHPMVDFLILTTGVDLANGLSEQDQATLIQYTSCLKNWQIPVCHRLKQ